MKDDNLALMIEGREYRVLSASASAGDLASPQIHSLALGWDAPFAGAKLRLAVRSGDAVRDIRVLSARFRDGAQQLAFLYA